MQISGFPWWLPPKDAETHGNGAATITLASVSRAKLTESWIHYDDLHEDLESFSVTDLSQAAWNRGPDTDIYCAEPIADPIAVFTSLERFLTDTECPFGYPEFLHEAHSLSDFLALCAKSTFLAAQAPEAVCKVLSQALHRQGVRHSVLPSERPYVSGHLVQWWDGFAICETATLTSA